MSVPDERADARDAAPLGPRRDDDPAADVLQSKVESLREMSRRLRAAAESATDLRAKRHYAMRALRLAQEAEALARSS